MIVDITSPLVPPATSCIASNLPESLQLLPHLLGAETYLVAVNFGRGEGKRERERPPSESIWRDVCLNYSLNP